jgi:hypothetical protein
MLTNKVKTTILVSITAVFVTAGCGALYSRADEQPRDPGKVRPITQAESVLAVYRENLGEASDGTPALIFAAWPDGYVVWSKDRIQGGGPYQAGKVEFQKIAAILARFGTDGLFADDKLNRAHFGPDSPCITVLIKSGKKQVKMRSWHELFEASDKLVVTSHGVESRDNARRLEVFRKEPADYLFFRFVWSETRSRLTELIPSKGTLSAGKLVMQEGELSWYESGVEGQKDPANDAPRSWARRWKTGSAADQAAALRWFAEHHLHAGLAMEELEELLGVGERDTSGGFNYVEPKSGTILRLVYQKEQNAEVLKSFSIHPPSQRKEDKREQAPRFKGVELYSWKDKDGGWVFALLDGTNRLKTEEQVKGAKNQIRGAENLKKAFTRLAEGEQVSWTHRIKGFEFPPEATRKEIEKAATEAKIDLETSAQKE